MRIWVGSSEATGAKGAVKEKGSSRYEAVPELSFHPILIFSTSQIGSYKYTGEWQNDRRNGAGKEIFKDVHTSFEGEFCNDRRVRGKVSVEAPGKMPLHVEVDYEKEKDHATILKLPPPVVGIQLMLFESDISPEL